MYIGDIYLYLNRELRGIVIYIDIVYSLWGKFIKDFFI